ncbi:alpha/beta fold hydrolase [Nocardiopsis sp. FIRDI 009]|uniref:alpha/beta fold hydrolase n=1 Tax=Nocardiopsis sp. FIRDI 009 TaxID=714197 RepID=UPI000E2625D3|nr:alpha/beta hydrolase [Nocardiopsis sp. FIRDI 009]
MHHLHRPRGRIAYDLYGPGNDGTLVVCVPGMFDHRASFRFVGAALADAGHRVAVMDLRGHGDSDTTFDRYDNRAAAEDALALIEELDGTGAVVVGCSMGGAAATIAAGERPELVAGIALLGPFLRSATPNLFTRVMLRLLLLRPWGPKALTSYYDSLHTGRKPEGHEEQKARVMAMLRPPDRFRAVRSTIHAPHEEVLDADGLSARAVVLVGEQDPDWPDPAAEAAWVASVVGGSVRMVPECGHYPQSQRPDLVVPALLDLVEEVRAGA